MLGFDAGLDLGPVGDRRLATDVDDVGTGRDQLVAALALRIEVGGAAVGEGVRAGVDDAHDERALDRAR